MIDLSILICTMPHRREKYDRLMDNLFNQAKPFENVEILADHRGPERETGVTTGEKRNALIDACHGKYFVFIDDDDWVAADYVDLIVHAVSQNPDVVTFQGWITNNGANRVDWTIRLGENYEARTDARGLEHYYRFPNHLAVMKKELVKNFRFLNITQGEDYEWSKRINDAGVLKTEVHLHKQIYHYDCKTVK